MVAKEIANKLEKNTKIKEIKVIGPYINFFINEKEFAKKTITKILKEQEKYGSSNTGKKQKIIIEHTSINPNSSPHIGRARNAILGDSITKIMKFQNYDPEVHFFVNDVGKQIAMLVYACKNKKPTFNKLLDFYIKINKKLKEQPELEKKIFDLLNKLEKGNIETRKKFREVVKICIEGQKRILNELGIKYDFFDYESDYLWDNSTKKILNKLKKKEEVFLDANNRYVINQGEFINEMKNPYFVLTRSDGTSLYSLRDLAYTISKLTKAKKNIIILGEEQKLYFKQLSSALNLLGYKPPKVLHYSFVLLSDKSKMSTRKGNLILLEDFMKELVNKASKEIKIRKKIKYSKKIAKIIAYGALKYNILKVSADKNVIFDWESALSFNGESCPYIQYAYTRASSILRKQKPKQKKIDFNLIKTKEEKNLIKELSVFPNIVLKAEKELKPHLIANYVYKVSKLFTDFYTICKVLSKDKDLSNTRLSITLATKYTIGNSLYLLGIKTTDRM
jgi:arginyl-tRNA synthetase